MAIGLASVGMVAILAQITLGGWTSANYAALACPDFPTCHGSLWPPVADWSGALQASAIGDAYPRLVAIQMAHRYGAALIACLAAILAFFMWRQSFPGARRWSVFLISIIAVQWMLGIITVLWRVPLVAAVLHNAMAAMIFLAMATIFYRAWTLSEVTDHAG